jgi:hypothetical protein
MFPRFHRSRSAGAGHLAGRAQPRDPPMSRQRAAALLPACTLHRFQILIHSSPRSALLAAASSRRSRRFVFRWFKLNIDGDRIAGRKCLFQASSSSSSRCAIVARTGWCRRFGVSIIFVAFPFSFGLRPPPT